MPDETKNYSKGEMADLPEDDSDLTTPYGDDDYANVASDDDITVDQGTGNKYAIHLFKNKGIDPTHAISVSWTGKSNVACPSKPVYLQIYNRILESWETLATNSIALENEKFTLAGIKSIGLSNYYDGNLWFSCRIYQHI